MKIEILFPEVCGLYGDAQNVTYLQATLPDAEFICTPLTGTPYFTLDTPDLIYIGSMSENTQRTVIQKLLPYRDRILELIESGVVILATGNASDVFCKEIDYVTEKINTSALNIFDYTVKNDLFDRYNGKVIGKFEDMTIVGFRSQFSEIFGNNDDCYFVECQRGMGMNKGSKLEGFRKNNLFCTHILGPIFPLNPIFCEHLIGLSGHSASAAYRDAAMIAYEQRVTEFTDPNVKF